MSKAKVLEIMRRDNFLISLGDNMHREPELLGIVVKEDVPFLLMELEHTQRKFSRAMSIQRKKQLRQEKTAGQKHKQYRYDLSLGEVGDEDDYD